MSETKETIGWIGAGKMGLPICVRLKASGHEVQVLARSEQSEAKLKAAGLAVKRSIAETCHGATIVFSSISDDAALVDVVSGKGGIAETLAKCATYIDISTVSPDASRQVAERLSKAGIHYLRSPVSGSTVMAESGTLTAMVSGPQAEFQRLEPLFALFARKSFHVGETEEARFLKLVLNSMVAATSALLAEALAFGAKGGLDIASMLNVVNQSVVASPLIAYKTDMMVKSDYKPAATLSMLKKDVDLFLATGASNHLTMPLAQKVQEIYGDAASRGLGEQDFFVLVADALQRKT